jgi:hypothetical protein
MRTFMKSLLMNFLAILLIIVGGFLMSSSIWCIVWLVGSVMPHSFVGTWILSSFLIMFLEGIESISKQIEKDI